ncbi:ATP-grasp domain-containing protein [Rummeliibacillus suwonensis]|uniref:ATP-grasp domain-containing protein n=1 Tax=Rummeliibacillus suwonensis TaxID=1306154 RepID=UPI001AAFFC07|nr:ATP-grasp domain-containing protein [Rummeliibacillus suwonensis]MBO2537226.1 ATP-grasp domain-containing protein [Rummeliibacillus suwonensis]
MNSKFVVLISPRDNEVQLVKRYGYKIILLRKEITFEEILEVEVPIEIDLNNESVVINKCLEISEDYNIISVFTMNEYRIPLASKLSEVLGLKYGLSYEASSKCRNKKLARQKLNELETGKVQYQCITIQDDLTTKLKNFNFPLIVKPSNDSGSKNVFLCQNTQEVSIAVNSILKSGVNNVGQIIDPEILIEEFLEGPEFSVESFTIHGQTTIIGITQKIVTQPPLSIEIGHDFPANLDSNQAENIEDLVIKSLKAIGVDHAVTHTEVKLTKNGSKIVEINARPGGDEIPHLVKVVTGIDLKDLAFRVTLGKELDRPLISPPEISSASIRFILSEEEGIASFDNGFTSPYIIRKKWYIQNGDKVKKSESNFDRLGYFIVYGNEKTSSADRADLFLQQLDVKIRKLTEA